MEYYFGVDIGTTSVKSIAFSVAGKALYEQSISYPIHHPHNTWSEQDPEEIAKAVFKTVENLLLLIFPAIPQSIGFSSAMHSLIAVDSQGQALSPCLIWADNRSADMAKKIHLKNQAEKYYRLTGVPVHAMSPLCKLMWIREYQPELFHSAYKFIGIKEFIFFKLFGIFTIDISIASATGLMNASEKKWDSWILEQLELQSEKFSEITETTQIFYSPSNFPTLSKAAFVIGGSDGAMANYGSTREKETLVVTVGTSSAARVISSIPTFDSQMRTFCYRQSENAWLIGGASNNGGVILQWLHQKYFASSEPFESFLQKAQEVKPGSDGLIFLPYLLGERAPHWNPESKGVLFGLTINHGQAEMIRAAMEAVIYCLYSISQPLLEENKIKKIYASGGFARNDIWLQMLADVFNIPVLVGETIESSAWGAAKLAMEALSIKGETESGINKRILPNEMVSKIYAKTFEKFQRVYVDLKNEFIS